MNVKEFYRAINGSYESALSIMINDDLIIKMIAKFMSDNSFNEILSFYEKKDYRNLFFSAHAFKGVTGNLALTPLYELASKITEATRNDDGANLDEEIIDLKKAYALVADSYAKYLI